MILATAIDSVLQFFVAGGFFTMLLVVLSVVALTVMILRGFALRSSNVMPDALTSEVRRLEAGDDLAGLEKLMDAHPCALSRILLVLVRHLTWPRSDTTEAVQTQARHEMARMESGLVVLEISTGIAPLLGLLGTLSGLVGIFASLGVTGDPIGVARGISEALNTTIVGLAVAAPSLIAHSYFLRKIEVMAVELESITAELLSKCYPHPEERPSFESAGKR